MHDYTYAAFYDTGVCQAIMNYFRLGLHPGSFAEACLLGDYDLAYSRAHFKLKQLVEGENVIVNMIDWVKGFPNCCHGSNQSIVDWMQHEGLSKVSKSKLVMIRLQWNEEFLGSFDSMMKSLK